MIINKMTYVLLFLPLIVFDAGFVNDVPMIIRDEPELIRIFRPGIFINTHEFLINY